MADRYFEREAHALKYARFRHPPPFRITEKILKFVEEKIKPPYQHAVDVGCGTGQSTLIWLNYFQKVTGCDVSSAQIKIAQKENQRNNISYLECPAHNIPLPDHSVDLISTVASLHWFDLETFFQEAKRLLKPNGVLAVQAYHKPILLFDIETKNEVAEGLIRNLLGKELLKYWSPKIEINKKEFSDVSFPFNQVIKYTDIRSEVRATVGDVIGFITSYSSYQKMRENEPDRLDCLMKDFRTRLLELADGEDNSFIFARDHYLILCREEL